jgi:hypothetical protein
MKRIIINGAAVLILTASSLMAQALDLSHLDRLAEKSGEVTNVTLDENLIKLASSFLKGGGSELDEVRKILPGIRGIYVRSFEFDREGVYSKADVDRIDQQLKGWVKIVESKKARDREQTRILMKPGNSNGEAAGFVILTTSPKELTVVNIAGRLTAEQLEKLGGQLGIPEMPSTKKDQPSPRKDEE